MLHQQCMYPEDAFVVLKQNVILHVWYACPSIAAGIAAGQLFIAALQGRRKVTLSRVCQHSAAQRGTAQHGTAWHGTGTGQCVAACSIGFQLDEVHDIPLPHASKPSHMPAMRHLTLSSSVASPGFTAGLSSLTSSIPESCSAFSVVPLSALHETRMCGDLWHNVSQT